MIRLISQKNSAVALALTLAASMAVGAEDKRIEVMNATSSTYCASASVTDFTSESEEIALVRLNATSPSCVSIFGRKIGVSNVTLTAQTPNNDTEVLQILVTPRRWLKDVDVTMGHKATYTKKFNKAIKNYRQLSSKSVVTVLGSSRDPNALIIMSKDQSGDDRITVTLADGSTESFVVEARKIPVLTFAVDDTQNVSFSFFEEGTGDEHHSNTRQESITSIKVSSDKVKAAIVPNKKRGDSFTLTASEPGNYFVDVQGNQHKSPIRYWLFVGE